MLDSSNNYLWQLKKENLKDYAKPAIGSHNEHLPAGHDTHCGGRIRPLVLWAGNWTKFLEHLHLTFAGVVCLLSLQGRQEHCPFTTRLRGLKLGRVVELALKTLFPASPAWVLPLG